MDELSNQTIAHYSHNAQQFSERFDLLSFNDVHATLQRVHIPPNGNAD